MTDPGFTQRNGQPHIDSIEPAFAMPGGEIKLIGHALAPRALSRPVVQFGDTSAPIVIGSEKFVVARVPHDSPSSHVSIQVDGRSSNQQMVRVSMPIAENLHPVANPAIDHEGNLYVTFSGSRGQKVPVAIYKVDTNYTVKPFVTEMMNPTGMAFDRAGQLYVSSRFDGSVYRVAANGTMSSYAEGMGVATGIAFDTQENLFVGDRSGTVFKIARDRQIYVFATLEPSVSAYHLAFGPAGNLYVSGPTTGSFDTVYQISPEGEVTTYYRGLGRPQGLAFDIDGNLYVAASLNGKRGIVRVNPRHEGSLVVSGNNLVGLAFAPNRAVVLATTDSVHHLWWDIQGRPLF
ncbi:MAG TPA: IPT/TIG domain-containing protein [Candidatus Koribacter sp.]|jgi:sugar lactone lactonase YvrE